MPTRRLISAMYLAFLCASGAQAQDAVSTPAPVPNSMLAHRPPATATGLAGETVPLTVPKGSAVQVVLDKEVRIQKVGQPVHGRVAEPVYAFDKLVVPVGSKATGHVTQLDGASGGKRFLDAMDADFSPPRKVQIEFDDLELNDGRHIPIHTTVTPGSGQVIQFVTAADGARKRGAKGTVSEKADEAKQEAKQEWDEAMKQVHEPGKMHKLERYAVSQLPVHPQYLDAGSVYFAELGETLEFGTEVFTPEMASSLNTPPPPGSLVYARLVTGLSSATAQKGDQVEAVLSRPLFDGDRLLLPQGSRLKGSVVQVRPARRLSHNGQMRIVFHELVLPDGIERKVQASLEAIQASKGQDVKLDSEGGAEVNTPNTRYLATGISVALALASAHGDGDARDGDVGGNTSNRVAGGAGGFRLVGIALGILVHSQPLGMAMGAYGASLSVYRHFIARGRDLLFPKNTAMEISIGTRVSAPAPGSPNAAAPKVTKQ